MTHISGFLVKKANDLTIARYSMTVNEQRLLLACISQIPVDAQITSEFEFVLTIEQAQDLFYSESSKKNIYRDMREAVAALYERDVKIPLQNGDVLQTRFVSSIVWVADKNTIKVNFAPKILPYLTMLKSNFTRYRLGCVVQLTSFYAVRIYELIVNWWQNGQCFKKQIEIEELKQILDIEEKYTQFGEFKKSVIERAISQINESTDFQVKVEFKKLKRSFKWITFTWSRKEEAIQAEKAKKETAERNRIAKQNREYAEQKAAEQSAAEEQKRANELAEQQRQEQERAEQQAMKENALRLWQSLNEEQREQVKERALKTVHPFLLNAMQICFDENKINQLTVRFFEEFQAALQPFDVVAQTTGHTEKQTEDVAPSDLINRDLFC